jgi:hypothetical protein
VEEVLVLVKKEDVVGLLPDEEVPRKMDVPNCVLS